MKNAKSEEKGALDKKKKIGSVSHATDERKDMPPGKRANNQGVLLFSPIFSLSLVLIFSLSKQRAPKKKDASLWWCDDDVVNVVNGANAEARSHLLK